MYKENKRYVFDTYFIKLASEYKLSLNEFILIIYFDNGIENVVNIKNISRYTKLCDKDIMLALSSLIEKKLIKLNVEKNDSNKICEVVSLDGLYEYFKKGFSASLKKEKSKDIYAIFEDTFKRKLSSNECEVIKVWIDNSYKEELILRALKEASYNGALNLSYIDKLLYDWSKKGIKNELDLDKKEKSKVGATVPLNILEYDWLSNE